MELLYQIGMRVSTWDSQDICRYAMQSQANGVSETSSGNESWWSEPFIFSGAFHVFLVSSLLPSSFRSPRLLPPILGDLLSNASLMALPYLGCSSGKCRVSFQLIFVLGKVSPASWWPTGQHLEHKSESDFQTEQANCTGGDRFAYAARASQSEKSFCFSITTRNFLLTTKLISEHFFPQSGAGQR